MAAVGALFGGSLTIIEPGKNQDLTSFLFSILIPLFSVLILLVWTGEAMRMKRINDYLSGDVEAKINYKFGKYLIGWESLLKVGLLPRDSYLGASMFTLIIFFFLIFGSPLFGLYLSKIPFEFSFFGIPVWQIWIPWIIGFLLGLYLFIFRKRLIGEKVVKSAFKE